MDVDMDTSPSPAYYDPEDLTIREELRRFGKRHSSSSASPYRENSGSKFSEGRLLYHGKSIERRPNAALLLEDIKQEVENYESYRPESTPFRAQSASKRSLSVNSELDGGFDSIRGGGNYSLKQIKHEDDSFVDSGESTFSLFASLFDSALQGLMTIPDLILRFEACSRNVSESIRYGSNERHRAVEDRLMRQKARLLLDEAASWSLLWFLYGKGNEDLPEDLLVSPPTSHLEACQFVAGDHTTQLCLRIVQWLEGLASKALDLENKERGSHIGTYLHSSGVWHHTQRFINRGRSDTKTVQHLDFDAPTREHAQPLPDDKKQDEALLEDLWILLRAGRLEEACALCRSAGQPWRAATLCPFGGLDQVPCVEAILKNGKNRTLQAIELESGVGHQWQLGKWASYCASEKIADQDGGKFETAIYAAQCSNLNRMLLICTDWESACWAMAKSWLDFMVDMELACLDPRKKNLLKSYEDNNEMSPGQRNNTFQITHGSQNWPLQVLNQQPRNISALLQKIHSSEMVHETVNRGCKEQHRQIEMNLMLGEIPQLLDLIWSWISPAEKDQNVFKPHGDPQMIRFGAHLVLVLRFLLGDQLQDSFREKIMTIGDLILNMYAMFLFTKQHEELVGIYASQLAPHRCIDLFVHMMELRLNSSLHVKYKIFLSAMEYLPYSPGDESKGSFEEIIERVLLRSREIKVGKYDNSSDVAEQHRLQSFQKAMVVQWLCFTPPSTINNVKAVSGKLLFHALFHSNILFREFALISMWRVPEMPIGAHALLSLLTEPLKQPTETLFFSEDRDFSENMKEFEDWSEYYSCDATYRHWLKIEIDNAEISSSELSAEEKQRAVTAGQETLASSLFLLKRKENPWMAPSQDHVIESMEPVFLELHATAVLCLPTGECMCPDATLCATLTSALYSSISEEEVMERQVMVNVTISQKNNYCIDVLLRCLAVDGDGLGPSELTDGGILATVIAAGFKGELGRFQAGVTLEISKLDAWYSSKEGSLEGPATYIVRGLCRRCCLPEVILRCIQVSVSLIESGNPSESHDELIKLVTSPETGFLYLFSQQQLQEFLLFEREYSINLMELQEELSTT